MSQRKLGEYALLEAWWEPGSAREFDPEKFEHMLKVQETAIQQIMGTATDLLRVRSRPIPWWAPFREPQACEPFAVERLGQHAISVMSVDAVERTFGLWLAGVSIDALQHVVNTQHLVKVHDSQDAWHDRGIDRVVSAGLISVLDENPSYGPMVGFGHDGQPIYALGRTAALRQIADARRDP